MPQKELFKETNTFLLVENVLVSLLDTICVNVFEKVMKLDDLKQKALS